MAHWECQAFAALLGGGEPLEHRLLQLPQGKRIYRGGVTNAAGASVLRRYSGCAGSPAPVTRSACSLTPSARSISNTRAERSRCAPWLPQAQTTMPDARAAARMARSLPRPTGSRAALISPGSVARQPKRLVTISAPKPQRSAYSRARVQDGSRRYSSAVLGLSIRKFAVGAAASQRRQSR